MGMSDQVIPKVRPEQRAESWQAIRVYVINMSQ